MRQMTCSGLVFGVGLLILTGAVVPQASAQQTVAELASGAEMLPAFRDDLEPAPVHQAEARPETVTSDQGLLSAETQVASRIPGVEAIPQAATTAGPPRYFKEDLPQVTLNEYLKAGYLTDKADSGGSIIRNQDFWVNITQGETVYIDLGASKGLKIGDHYLIYLINENFKSGPDYNVDNQHPVLNDKGQPKVQEPPSDLWNLGSETELGVWHKKLDFFDKFIKPQGRPTGDMVRVVGTLRITEVGEKVSSGVIEGMYDLIPRGARVAPYPQNLPAMVMANQKNPAKNLTGYVVDNGEGYRMVGEKDMVFLDLGTADNVAPGDRFEVMATNREEDLKRESLLEHFEHLWEDEPRDMLERTVGEVVVISVREKTSTAVVVDSKEPILPGQRIRSKP